MRPYRYIINVLLIVLVVPGLATADLREQVESALTITNPKLSVKSIQDSPVEGIKEIKLSNGQFLYAEPGSDHVFSPRNPGRTIPRSGSGKTGLKDFRV